MAFWGAVVIAAFCLCQNAYSSELKETRPDNQPNGRYASIIIDLGDNEIIHARQIDELRYPASLTKVMTLYMAFEALEKGDLKIDQVVIVSENAASQPASKLGLRAGQKVIVKDMINAMIVKSANDAAMVIAEAIGGSEVQFADMMTAKAWDLKMRRTTFKNPHGLTQAGHVTTARDMAKLGAALIRDHRTYYPLFSQQLARFEGRLMSSSNKLLGKVDGVDGLKTGYTNASGHNLIISAEREGHRIVAVVMGGSSRKGRDDHMKTLVERGFEVIKKRAKIAPAQQTPQRLVKIEPLPKAYAPISASNMIASEDSEQRPSVILPNPAILKLRGSQSEVKSSFVKAPKAAPKTAPKIAKLKPIAKAADIKPISKPDAPNISPKPAQKPSWSVNLGLFGSEKKAVQYLFRVTDNDEKMRPHFFVIAGNDLYQAQLSGLSQSKAKALCKKLEKEQTYCRVSVNKAVKLASR